ncbi:uncharacterized protein C11orf87-like [Limanda limanda]|uniref:uncharacterized protein C11orf87-like n=1 Tax=Limanda limanda TaxID=27771 RepID=UPI0029C67779|nr:uncharacterized protein C11orf87-like [Limanda limanda]
MTDRTTEAPGLPVPPRRCHGGLQAVNSNGTCAEQVGFLPPFSSTLALLILVAVLAGVVLVSMATFHLHKRKLRKRKVQRAQEEYERDSRSPTRAGGASGGGDPARPCVIVRPPVRCGGVQPACRSEGGRAGTGAPGEPELQEAVALDC